jgi:hypothetical protein
MRGIARCTQTGKVYAVDMPADAQSVARYWRRTISIHCPHCGDTHLEGFQQLYVNAVMDRGTDRAATTSAPQGVR